MHSSKSLLSTIIGFPLTTNQVKDAIEQPEFSTDERSGRKGAYRSLDPVHAIRTIYEEHEGIITVVTNGGQED